MTALEALATVIGGFAALGTLIWVMVGSPSLVKAVRNRINNSSAPVHPPKRRVLNIEWGQLEAAARTFATENSSTYDLVVGIQPDGAMLANLLAARLQLRCVAMDKYYPQVRRTSFFVFDQNKHSRSVRASMTQFTPPSDIVNPSRVLIVDGVTTFGNGLLKAEEEVFKQFNDARIDFYVYAVDQPRLAASHPELAERVRYSRAIDNFVTWIHFPWEST